MIYSKKNSKEKDPMFDFFTKSDWIVIAILAALFILFWLIFGTDALKYLVA